MTESSATPAQKREWLKANGYDVGSRGKLSADHEEAFASQTPASAERATLAAQPLQLPQGGSGGSSGPSAAGAQRRGPGLDQ
jgi:hypothetical protein